MKQITCVCDARYVGCLHLNPCGVHVDNGTYAAHGPWCFACRPRRISAVQSTVDRIAVNARREK